ncbi:MAG TPA: plastocyanin/azurin family copper-binding protein [Chloroflexota bacterium]|nr:plastocyanin/azurin family copper-binding protein [Chloroflexota bacterium]
MRFALGPLALIPALALALGLAWWPPAPASAATATVTIYDGDTPPPPTFDPAQGWWGYAPLHVEVKRGEPVVFYNPETNRFPHTVTSISRGDGAGTLAAGAQFDSTPDPNTRINPGESWTLDTSTLNPGHYAYYCRLHLWMLGSVTVTP